MKRYLHKVDRAGAGSGRGHSVIIFSTA